MSAERRIRARNLALLGIAAIAAALVFAACGGFSGSGSTDADGEDGVTDNGGATEIVAASFPTGRDTDEVSASGSEPIAPCTLVPKKQAESILGTGVKVTERVQGPTCIYSGSGREIDLVVEKVPLKPLQEGARSAKPLTINGRPGWCLRYQSTAVVIDVGNGQIMQVTGACQAGVRFAAVALPRIPHAS